VKRAWLELIDWEFVTATNAALCQPKKARHKPTTDGHDRTRQLWEKNHRREMFLDEAADLCRQCHRLAPFCNFNGNTFAAIVRSLVDKRLVVYASGYPAENNNPFLLANARLVLPEGSVRVETFPEAAEFVRPDVGLPKRDETGCMKASRVLR